MEKALLLIQTGQHLSAHFFIVKLMATVSGYLGIYHIEIGKLTYRHGIIIGEIKDNLWDGKITMYG